MSSLWSRRGEPAASPHGCTRLATPFSISTPALSSQDSVSNIRCRWLLGRYEAREIKSNVWHSQQNSKIKKWWGRVERVQLIFLSIDLLAHSKIIQTPSQILLCDTFTKCWQLQESLDLVRKYLRKAHRIKSFEEMNSWQLSLFTPILKQINTMLSVCWIYLNKSI